MTKQVEQLRDKRSANIHSDLSLNKLILTQEYTNNLCQNRCTGGHNFYIMRKAFMKYNGLNNLPFCKHFGLLFCDF